MSAALHMHEYAVEQQFGELLRIIARAYYGNWNLEVVEDEKKKPWPAGAAVLVMDAMIEFDRNTQHNVKESDLADALKMSHKLVRDILSKFRVDKLIRSRQIEEIKEAEVSVLAGGHKILKARQPKGYRKGTPINNIWYLDADWFTKALRYRIREILSMLNSGVDHAANQQYVCPKPDCPRKGLKFNVMQLMEAADNFGDPTFRCKMCKTVENGKPVGEPLILTSESEHELTGGREKLKTMFNAQMEPIHVLLTQLEAVIVKAREEREAAKREELENAAVAKLSNPFGAPKPAAASGPAAAAATSVVNGVKTEHEIDVKIEKTNEGVKPEPKTEADDGTNGDGAAAADTKKRPRERKKKEPPAALPWAKPTVDAVAEKEKAAREAEEAKRKKEEQERVAQEQEEKFQAQYQAELQRMQALQSASHPAHVAPTHDPTTAPPPAASDGGATTDEVQLSVGGQLMPWSVVIQSQDLIDAMTPEEFEEYQRLASTE